MKVLILLALVTLASCVPLRPKRSFDHEYYDYDNTLYPYSDVYTIRQPAYSTHSVAPVYYELGRRELHTTSATKYKVHVPVTYTYTVDQPVHHSTVYEDTPRTVTSYSAPAVAAWPRAYSAPVETWDPVDTWSDASDVWRRR